MAEGSYWSNEFPVPLVRFFMRACAKIPKIDVAGAGELVLNATDTGTEPWTINSMAMLPHPLLRLRAMLTRSLAGAPRSCHAA